jgi:serine/threonine protein kinase
MDEMRLLNNRYELQEILGRGGMAVIYRARDLMLERPVAVKILREDFSRNPHFQERFRQEARAAANLSHPNIVTVHDFGFDRGQLFLVMEYVPGTDLKKVIHQRGRFSANDALPLIVQACAGIGYAHRAGLVHCDVKPQNMLVTPDLRLKVTDFGIARALASIHPDEQTDLVWGSPQYFAPEQAAGAAPSPASDVYSLGVILYEMLAGELPFKGTTASDLARLHVEAPPPDIRRKVPDINPELEQILLKVLAKEPLQRYRTADQLGHVLSNFVSVEKSPALALTPETGPVRTGTVRVLRKTPSAQSDTQPTPLAKGRAEESSLSIDWAAVGLGLLALVAVLGLIPFWIWVYFVYNPPIR